MEICDPHHHLWEYPDNVYVIDDLRRDAEGLDVTKTVFVECGSKYRAETPVTLDHIGGPIGIGPYAGRRDEVLKEWRQSMTDLAACESVVLKLGGIGMPIFGMDWHHRDGGVSAEEVAKTWGPEIRWLIE